MAVEATNDAAEAVSTTVADESTVDDTAVTPGAEALGDAGKKALDTMKAKWKAAEKERDTERSEYAAFKAKAEGKEVEYAAEQERRTAETAAQAKADARANERILKAEIRAVASKALADPADALKFLDLTKFEVGDDGDVDAEAIKAAVADLIKTKPYLAAQGGAGTVFESPGSHRKGAPAGQLTQSDLKNMTPAQINAARTEGRLNVILGFKS